VCGITGANAACPDSRVGEVVLALTRKLAHRGPDGEGFWRADRDGGELCSEAALQAPAVCALGHRRLAIVDLEGGSQPMSNEDGSVWVSFNGEIYNQHGLRRELERRGHSFGTQCDTEVLVHGWEEWGEGLFGKLNGIFAFALADARRDEVLLVRDPVGVKPLYLGVSGGLTWWASELAAASDSGYTSGRLSLDALKLFLVFRYVPSPLTIFEDAWKVPPAHFVRLRADSAGLEPVFVPYRAEVRSSLEPRTRAEWRHALVEGLEAAVRRQLMADVPLASLLSGGVDSSLVTQLMAEQLPYVPQTFGIGFDGDGRRSEALAARRAAGELGVPHCSTVVSDAEYLQAWPAALAELGEPIANSGALLVRMLCAEVARTHKVALAGQGADEPLGGYPRHVVERLRPLGSLVPRAGAMVIARGFGPDSGERLRRALAAPSRLDRYVEIFSIVPAPEVDELIPDGRPALELARESVGRWLAEGEPEDTVNELLRIDARMSLADDLLLVADHFSMRSSVELRVPFLDLELLELVERMPGRYKISALGERKWLYRSAARGRLPRALARRVCGPGSRVGAKRGFSAPLERLFTAGDGAVTAEEQWAQPLVRHLSNGAVSAAAGETGRRRSLLYSLATWLAVNPGASRTSGVVAVP
jgi:asparagine synthase (glutamine-hydrolysing)